jgi:hypothetical protein
VRGDAAVRANPAVFGGAARAARRDGGGQLTASIRLRYAKWLAHQRSRESAASEITGGAPSQPFDLSVLRAVFAASDALDRPRSADLLALGRLPGCHVALTGHRSSSSVTSPGGHTRRRHQAHRTSSPSPLRKSSRRRPSSPTLEEELAELESSRAALPATAPPLLPQLESVEEELVRLLAMGVQQESVHSLLFAAKALLCLAEQGSTLPIGTVPLQHLARVRVPARPALRSTLERMRHD